MRELTQRLLRSAVFWNYLTVALRSGAAILLLPLLLRKLSPDELGLWYIFLSLAGMGALFDLGFGNSLNRSTGYLWAGADRLLPIGLEIRAKTEEVPPGPNYSLLGRLVATMRLFYLVLGLVILVLLQTAGGAWIWYKSTGLATAENIRAAWAVFALGCALNTVGSLWPTLLTGINGVRQAQKVFLAALVVNYVLSIYGLLAGWGLWGPVSGQVAMGLINRGLGRLVFLRLAGHQLKYSGQRPDLGLLRILWPNSWRVGAVTIGIYLTTYTVTLMASVFLDLAQTASFGLCMQLGMFIAQVSTVWVLVKMPLFNQLRQRGQEKALLDVFFARVWLFVLIFGAGATTLCLAGDWLLINVLQARTGLLPASQLAVLLLVLGLEAHQSLYRELVQTANVNPFVTPMLLTAALSLALICIFAPLWGAWGLILAPGLAQLVFNNWWIVLTGVRSVGLDARQYAERFLGSLCRLPEILRVRT